MASRQSECFSEESEPLSRETIEAVLKFLPEFQKEGFSAGTWTSNPGEFPYISYSSQVLGFIRTLYDTRFLVGFDWGEWQDVAEAIYHHPEQLATADLITVRRLLTLHIRKDRFCEGHLASMLEEGHISGILQRLKVLTEEMP